MTFLSTDLALHVFSYLKHDERENAASVSREFCRCALQANSFHLKSIPQREDACEQFFVMAMVHARATRDLKLLYSGIQNFFRSIQSGLFQIPPQKIRPFLYTYAPISFMTVQKALEKDHLLYFRLFQEYHVKGYKPTQLLFFAAKLQNRIIYLDLLLKSGANPNSEMGGKTPLEISVLAGNFAAAGMLAPVTHFRRRFQNLAIDCLKGGTRHQRTCARTIMRCYQQRIA